MNVIHLACLTWFVFVERRLFLSSILRPLDVTALSLIFTTCLSLLLHLTMAIAMIFAAIRLPLMYWPWRQAELAKMTPQ